MLQGLNNTCDIKRKTAGVDDAIGGVTTTEATVYSDLKCRVSNLNNYRLEKQLGVEIPQTIKVLIWPANYTIKNGDILIPNSGKFANQRFIITSSQEDSLLETIQRAHLEVTCERVTESRSNQ